MSEVLAVNAWLAGHRGIITRKRALALGMTPQMISTRIDRGDWQSAHRGVYRATSSPVSPAQALLAALAACGSVAMASHQSAAWLWHLVPDAPARPWVTVPYGRRARLTGVQVVRRVHLVPPVRRHGLPCTPAPKTVLDCASVLSASDLDGILDRALATRAVTLPALSGLLAAPGRGNTCPGRLAVRSRLESRGMLGCPAPSVLESRMSRLMAQHRLPVPAAELVVGRAGEYRLDFAYPDRLLAVEVDGYVWHSSPEHMRRDAARRNALARSGWTVLVYTWRDVTSEPARVAAEIASTHAGLRPSGSRELFGPQ